MTTTYRLSCGTHLGLIAHQASDEPPCGECRHSELVRLVSVEAWPVALWHPAAPPISREQAERNLAALMDAMADEPAGELAAVLPPGLPDTEETR
jgi:hypothetical protein